MAQYSVTIPLTIQIEVSVEHTGEYDSETILRLAHAKLSGDNNIVGKVDDAVSAYGLSVDRVDDDSNWAIHDEEGMPVYP
jgi:hypothetical protein